MMNVVPDPFLEPHFAVDRVDGAIHTLPEFSKPAFAPAKIVFDRLAAFLALLIVSPVMLGIAVLIMARRNGPVFYSHTRVGRNGRLFRCYKFRTMVPDGAELFHNILAIDPIAREDWVVRRKIHRDPRVSRLGNFLRSSSLDELPQFWNVLRGDMSLVGPRPITAEELVQYGDHARDYLSVRPGITGAWQVSGRSKSTFAERVALDVEYTRNAGLMRDISILVRTVRVVLSGQGAL